MLPPAPQYMGEVKITDNTTAEKAAESAAAEAIAESQYADMMCEIDYMMMLNDENIWNGLTYAFWLIYSDNHAWNNRRHDEAEGGYVDKNDDSENPIRHPDYHYSEIDIEIVKASRFWPKDYYGKRADSICVEQDETQNDDVM